MDIRQFSSSLGRHLLLSSSILASALLLERSIPQTQLEKVLETGELRVISRNGPTTYYEGAEGLTGYGYKLVKGFADHLGVKLVIINEANSPLEHLMLRDADMAAAATTTSEAGNLPIRFADAHRQLSFKIISHADHPFPGQPELGYLTGQTIEMTPEMASHPVIETIRDNNPNIVWHVINTNDQADLLERVHKGQVPFALIDSDTLIMHQYSFTNAQELMTLGQPQDLAWAFNQSADNSLFNRAQSYLKQVKQNGELAQITAEFFNPVNEMAAPDLVLMSQHIEERLVPWLDDMKRASEAYDLDWRLLAAIGYKESQWLTKIKSPTGVKGMMQLTRQTARAMGVSDREDPRQAIFGAAKLFRYLLDNQPASIEGEDRLHFALASYNQGMGHIGDARRLTKRMGGDPDSWLDVRQHLPLLSLSQYYSQARHGYMRGKEPVVFVDKVLDYYKLLVWHEQQQHLRLATASSNYSVL